ncbi:MAG: hypothetical protein NTV21_17320 [Planctomycetota bacterium]|nr:hypothetical protein [Planctomycetota bacterium]
MHAASVLLLSLPQLAGTPGLAERQVLAPASDIVEGVVCLPEPTSLAASSACSLDRLAFARTRDGWAATVELDVERDGGWSLVLLAPGVIDGRILAAPAGAPLRPLDASFALQRRVTLAGDDLPGWVVDRRDLRGAPTGAWTVRIEVDHASQVLDGWILATASSEVSAQAHFSSHARVRGEPLAVLARAQGRDALATTAAELELELEGAREFLPMLDDGLHADGAAGDGLFGAFLPTDALGNFTARAHVHGLTRGGIAFRRSVPLASEIHEAPLVLDGRAELGIGTNGQLHVAVSAQPLDTPRRVHASAELWGARNGVATPVVWLSRLLVPASSANGLSLDFELDERWLDLAGVQAPFELRQVRVQDPDSEGVLAFLAEIPLESVALAARAPLPVSLGANALLASNGTPLSPRQPAPSARPIQPALMLVHGYCSSGAIWPAAHFSAPKLNFLDANANRSHDQFAQLLIAQANAAQLSSYGIVAHSQGGAAALHLLTYYTSGLDYATGQRLIQSVATPYLGTPLASLGFFACGVNSNMTPSGAPTWLAGIPSWARAKVHYWTTSNSGSACNGLTDFFLSNPEDGTVERTRGQLSGGNSMGHVTGWCHTTGMSNPANYTDATRNAAMNAAASR